MAEYDRISHAFHADPANVDVNEEEWDELRDGAWPLAERIMELEPKTIADLGVQARALAYMYDEWWHQPFWGEEEEDEEEGDSHEIRHFIEAVLRLAGLPQPLQPA